MSESSLNISKYVEVDTWVSVCDSWEAGTPLTHRQTVCLLTLLYYSLHSGGNDNDPVNPRHILLNISGPLYPLKVRRRVWCV